jgi:hypothetical protein
MQCISLRCLKGEKQGFARVSAHIVAKSSCIAFLASGRTKLQYCVGLPAIAYGVICCNNSDAAQRSLKLLQFAAKEEHLAHQKKL